VLSTQNVRKCTDNCCFLTIYANALSNDLLTNRRVWSRTAFTNSIAFQCNNHSQDCEFLRHLYHNISYGVAVACLQYYHTMQSASYRKVSEVITVSRLKPALKDVFSKPLLQMLPITEYFTFLLLTGVFHAQRAFVLLFIFFTEF